MANGASVKISTLAEEKKMNQNITNIFNQFAGREVPMVETQRTVQMNGKSYTLDEVRFANQDDPTIKAMQQVAKSHGLAVRIKIPGMAYTMDYRTDRVNAYVEKGTDGKWRIGNQFRIG